MQLSPAVVRHSSNSRVGEPTLNAELLDVEVVFAFASEQTQERMLDV